MGRVTSAGRLAHEWEKLSEKRTLGVNELLIQKTLALADIMES